MAKMTKKYFWKQNYPQKERKKETNKETKKQRKKQRKKRKKQIKKKDRKKKQDVQNRGQALEKLDDRKKWQVAFSCQSVFHHGHLCRVQILSI